MIEGASGVGKSTLIIETLGDLLARAGGFGTVRVLNPQGERIGFAVEPASVRTKPDKTFDGDDSRMYIRFDGRKVVNMEKFVECAVAGMNSPGIDAPGVDSAGLDSAGAGGFLIMDEFGGMELESEVFTAKALETLRNGKPVIGVIKSRANAEHTAKGFSENGGFLACYESFRRSITEQTDTEIVTLTGDNREEVRQIIQTWITMNGLDK